MNKKIAMSVMSIVSALTIMGGATFAAFTSQATMTGNTFAAGDASLLIAHNSGTNLPLLAYASTIVGDNTSGMGPGSFKDSFFWLKNDSDTTGASLGVTVDLTNLATVNGNADLKNQLLVKFTCDTGLDGLGIGVDTTTVEKSVAAWITDAPVTLATIGANQSGSNAAVASTSDQDEYACKMITTLPGTATDAVSGEDLSFTSQFDATTQAVI